VLTQGALFLLCFAVAVIRSLLAAQLNFLYHLKLPPQAGPPGAAHCISSSLLDPHLMKTTAETCLFLRGLVILGELAADPENCTEMYSAMDLVPKILAPVSNGLHHMLVSKSDATAAEIVRESLRVVAKLTSGTAGESGRKLCRELTTTAKYGRTAENILWILSD
jgi:hypothetical protein